MIWLQAAFEQAKFYPRHLERLGALIEAHILLTFSAARSPGLSVPANQSQNSCEKGGSNFTDAHQLCCTRAFTLAMFSHDVFGFSRCTGTARCPFGHLVPAPEE
jgi:hypothetical protein